MRKNRSVAIPRHLIATPITWKGEHFKVYTAEADYETFMALMRSIVQGKTIGEVSRVS